MANATISRLSTIVNIEIEKGSTFRHTLVWRYKKEPKDPIDLTGCTARMQIRDKKRSNTVFHEMTTENGGINLGDTAGTIELVIPDDTSTNWSWNAGVYGLEIILANGDVRRLCRGDVAVFDETTR